MTDPTMLPEAVAVAIDDLLTHQLLYLEEQEAGVFWQGGHIDMREARQVLDATILREVAAAERRLRERCERLRQFIVGCEVTERIGQGLQPGDLADDLV